MLRVRFKIFLKESCIMYHELNFLENAFMDAQEARRAKKTL
jgi:hypothetical protein